MTNFETREGEGNHIDDLVLSFLDEKNQKMIPKEKTSSEQIQNVINLSLEDLDSFFSLFDKFILYTNSVDLLDLFIEKLGKVGDREKAGFFYSKLIDAFYIYGDENYINEKYGSIANLLKRITPDMGDDVFWKAQKYLLEFYAGIVEYEGGKAPVRGHDSPEKNIDKFKDLLLTIIEGSPEGFIENINLFQLRSDLEKSFPDQKQIIAKLDEIIETSKKALNLALVNEFKNFASQ